MSTKKRCTCPRVLTRLPSAVEDLIHSFCCCLVPGMIFQRVDDYATHKETFAILRCSCNHVAMLQPLKTRKRKVSGFISQFPSGFADDTLDSVFIKPQTAGWFIDQEHRNWVLFTTKRVQMYCWEYKRVNG